MKTLFNSFIAVLLISLFVAGCKKDEDKTVKNYFNYDGTEFKLSQGFLENYGKYDNQGYNLDLTLLSSSFVVHESNGEIDSLSGTGDGINFEIYTSLPGKLDVKDYVYDATESGADGTFDYGSVVMNYNTTTELGSLFYITGGKVSVTSNGSEYEISLNCTVSSGKTITGYYKGSLKYYNYDKKKKSAPGFPMK